MDRSSRVSTIEAWMGALGPAINSRPIPAEHWPHMVVLTGADDVHRPFGYVSPVYLTYDGKWAVLFCTEVIADATGSLTEPEMGRWLRYVTEHVEAHIRLGADEEAVDEEVFSLLPDTRDVVAKVLAHVVSG